MTDTPSDLRLVYMTAPDKAEAVTLARALVEARLVACVNILDGVTSVYWWEGSAQEDGEVVLIAKTKGDRMAALTDFVRTHHSYDVPCVVSLPVSGQEGNSDFLAWIREEASAGG